MSNEFKVILAGFGGQGVLFAGKVIANAGLIDGKEVSWFPSYGPEMRGGTASCSVTLSDEPIGSPLVVTPDAVVAMNQPSYDKFIPKLAEGGIAIFDTDLVSPDIYPKAGKAVGIPATSEASDNELTGLSNIVLLGKLWQETQFCNKDALLKAIDACVPPKKAHLIEKNKQALELGIDD